MRLLKNEYVWHFLTSLSRIYLVGIFCYILKDNSVNVGMTHKSYIFDQNCWRKTWSLECIRDSIIPYWKVNCTLPPGWLNWFVHTRQIWTKWGYAPARVTYISRKWAESPYLFDEYLTNYSVNLCWRTSNFCVSRQTGGNLLVVWVTKTFSILLKITFTSTPTLKWIDDFRRVERSNEGHYNPNRLLATAPINDKWCIDDLTRSNSKWHFMNL